MLISCVRTASALCSLNFWLAAVAPVLLAWPPISNCKGNNYQGDYFFHSDFLLCFFKQFSFLKPGRKRYGAVMECG